MGMMRDGGKTWTEGEKRASPLSLTATTAKGREKAASGQTHPAACLALPCLGPSLPTTTRVPYIFILVPGACWPAYVSNVVYMGGFLRGSFS